RSELRVANRARRALGRARRAAPDDRLRIRLPRRRPRHPDRKEAVMRELAIGICQLRSEIGRDDYDPRPANLDRALDAIATTADAGAKLSVFGEVFLNGYETNELTPTYAVAESPDDPWVARLVEEA